MKTDKEITEMKEEINKILSNPESTTETLKYYQGFLGGLDWLLVIEESVKKTETTG
jgi:hypothetical protein